MKQISSRSTLVVLGCLLAMGAIACEHSITNPKIDEIEFLGFEDKFALRLVLAEPYLYVCAGSDGVWKRNMRNMDEWQYLGLADTSLGKYTHVGALDIDVLGEDILVAYNGSGVEVEPESTVAVWRSPDGGRNWVRSDNGIPETIDFRLQYNVLTSLQRSPHEPNIALGWLHPTSYRSTNGGQDWTMLSGDRGVLHGDGYVRWHPFRPGEAWFFGETALFAPYCGAVEDYGTRGKTGVNFDSLDFPSDAAVRDVAFDADDPEIVYAATSHGVIKTTDGGYTWRKNAVRIPDNGFIFRMAHHPSIGGVLYLAGGRRVYVTRNGGTKVQLIGEIERGFITSLALDTQGNQLLVGTTEGGIYALILGQ